MNPQLDKTKLSVDQQAQLESYQQAQDQLQALEDIAKMTQELVSILDDQKKDKSLDNLGTLLVDIRESLAALNGKEAAEAPDYAKPVVEAVSKLEKALSASIKAIDVKPQVTVAAPSVNVSPDIDLSGVETAIKGLPKIFQEAIKSIPKTPETNFKPLLAAWEGISEQLVSIETATRLKPQMPNTLKVTNPDGSIIGGTDDLVPGVDYDNLLVTNTSSTTDTVEFNLAANPVKTLSIVYTNDTVAKVSDELVSVDFS